jgi:hypothetical protein
MPGPILCIGSTVMCPHGGHMDVVPGSLRVAISGMAVATMADTFPVMGCVFTVGTKAQPCVTVEWLVPAARVRVMGQPVVTQASVGICRSAELIPQGSPSVLRAQSRVIAT